MAARRSPRRGGSNGVSSVGLGCAIVAGLVAVLFLVDVALAVLQRMAAHPLVTLVVAPPLFVGGSGLAGWLWWRRRERQRALRAWHHAEAVRQQQIHAARMREIATYDGMSWREFEEALGFLCRRDGCTVVEVSGRTGDLGADVLAVTPEGRRLVIQAKRYVPGKRVTGPDLQRFGGTCFNVHRADVAAVVTTAGYTKQAVEYARHMGIRLFDRDALAGWASQTGPAPWH